MAFKRNIKATSEAIADLRRQGLVLPKNAMRAAASATEMARMSHTPGTLQKDLSRISTSSLGGQSPNEATLSMVRENSRLARAMGGSRATNGSMQKRSSAGGGDVYAAIPRFYDPMEYWDLSGLPWNMADEGHRHKLHKWLRLFYATHYLVPSLVDIFTRFPLAEMHFECKDEKLTDFYSDMFLDKLDYQAFLTHLGREYWTVGEAFPLGQFNESLGIWEDEQLLNPEDITVENFPILGSQQLKVVPPEYLKRLVQNKMPAKEYKQLQINFPDLIPYLERGEPFPVSDVLIKQVSFRVTPWDDHGTPILLRGLRTLIHEEKLLASQDAIAERLYSPLILAKLGFQDLGDGMPPWIPGPEDLDAFRDEMDIALSSDFRLMVHHFGVEVSSVFGREQMPDLYDDFDRVERRLMQVFGINPSLLSAGSNSQPYASSALQAEFMNQMLRTYQQYLKKHARERALIVAEAQGHYDYEKKGATRVPIMEDVVDIDEEGNIQIIRKNKLLVPDLEMAVLDMRDEATERQFLQQLRAMGVPISDRSMMIGVNKEYKDSLNEMEEEMKWKTVAQQRAKLETFEQLTKQGLPVPPDLVAEIAAAGAISDPNAGGSGIMGPNTEADGGPVGPAAPGGGNILMPPPPGDLTPSVPGGGPAVTRPEGPGGGPVPEISNERRKGLEYNTVSSVNGGGDADVGESDENEIDLSTKKYKMIED